MSWVPEHLGAPAIISAGQALKDRVREAIQRLTENIQEKRVYTHLGWRWVEPYGWMYLHANGAIGQTGQVGQCFKTPLSVRPPDDLQNFSLPQPPVGQDLHDAFAQSWQFLSTGPAHIVFPLWASIFRAALGETPYSLFLVGSTGVRKSTLAALVQQFFGKKMDMNHLPGEWSSTPNALELLAFHAKDSLLVIDDFCPTGSSASQAQYHANADRVLRGQGNRSGRKRLGGNHYDEILSSKPPRGLILATGEEIPKGESLQARFLVIPIEPGDINLEAVTRCQGAGGEGRSAQVMAAYVQWVAENYESIKRDKAIYMEHFRRHLNLNTNLPPIHPRTQQIIADLFVGIYFFCEFAKSKGLLTPRDPRPFYESAWQALVTVASLQAHTQAVTNPANQFLDLLRGALSLGMAHINDKNEGLPRVALSHLNAMGWRPAEGSVHPQPQGTRIGWMDGQNLYLYPDGALSVATSMAKRTNVPFHLTKQTLGRRLREKGLLLAVDETRQTNTHRAKCEGVRREVWIVSLKDIYEDLANPSIYPDQPDQPDQGSTGLPGVVFT